jgi:glycerophosphoryl diester phosphodiesterase
MLKIGHRGAPAYALENTITSFQKALEMGVDGIELDVHVCASGELVVFHDFAVDRFTNGTGYVKNILYSQLQALSLPQNERIPTLEEVLDALGKEIYYFIEIKPAEALDGVIRVMQDYQARGWKNLILISFQHDALKRAPGIRIGATFEKIGLGDIKNAMEMGAKMVLPNHKTLTQKEVDEAHAVGLQVVVWTVNEPEDIARMKQLGVDGIMSDYPDRL